MKNFLYLSSLIVIAVLCTSCTQQMRAKQMGGTAKVVLPAAQKLVNATWKENSLWYLTRPSRKDEKPETYIFQESSAFGFIQGTVVFEEK